MRDPFDELIEQRKSGQITQQEFDERLNRLLEKLGEDVKGSSSMAEESVAEQRIKTVAEKARRI